MDEEVAPVEQAESVADGPEPQVMSEGRMGSMVEAGDDPESIAADETGSIEEGGRPKAPDEESDPENAAENVPSATPIVDAASPTEGDQAVRADSTDAALPLANPRKRKSKANQASRPRPPTRSRQNT